MDVADAIALYLLLEQQPDAYRRALEQLKSPTAAMASEYCARRPTERPVRSTSTR